MSEVEDALKGFSKSLGFLLGNTVVAPFLEGLMDAVEPKVKDRVSAAVPVWVKGLFRE